MRLFAIKGAILELIFPTSCFGCQTEGEFLCSACGAALKTTPPSCFVCKRLVPPSRLVTAGRTCQNCTRKSHIYAFLSPFRYEGVIKELIHGLKYRRITETDRVLAELTAQYLQKYEVRVPEGALLIPIPLHPAKKRTRGFNQAELIANRLAEKLPLKVDISILQKIQQNKPQIELSGKERRTNVLGVFAVSRPELIQNKTVIMLDDVKTTGATLEEAARVLKEAGAKRVWAITVAH